MSDLHAYIGRLMTAAEARGLELVALNAQLPARATFMVLGKNGIRGDLTLSAEHDLLEVLEDLIPVNSGV